MSVTLTPRLGSAWRAFFALAAVYNLVIGLVGFLGASATPIAQVVSALVACFGVIYALVAYDPLRFAPVVWAGLAGKLAVIAILGPAAFGAGGDRATAAALAGDALFALGFLAFLLGPAKLNRARQPS